MYITLFLVLFLQVGFEYLPTPEEIDEEYNTGGILMMKTDDFISINETPVKVDKVNIEIVDTLGNSIPYDSLQVPAVIKLLIKKSEKGFIVQKIQFVRKVTVTEKGYEGIKGPEELLDEKQEKEKSSPFLFR